MPFRSQHDARCDIQIPTPSRRRSPSAQTCRSGLPARRGPSTLRCCGLRSVGMKALCIVYSNVDDWESFDRYRSRVMPTLEPFGARFLVRGGAFTVVEGEMPFER